MINHTARHLCIQLLRRTTQILTIMLIITLPFISLYAHYRAANAIEDIQFMSGFRGLVLSRIDKHVAPMEDSQEFVESFKGTLWSMRLRNIDLSDPLAGAELIAASKTLYVPFIISIIIPVFVTLILGRIFCSWICPADLLFVITNKFRSVLKFAEIPPAEIEFSLKNKYIVLGVGLIAGVIVSQPLFALIYPPAVLSRLTHAWIFGTALTGMVILTLVLIAIELFISPRWWCRTMCPGGALYAIIGWPRLLRVKLNRPRCDACGLCQPVCHAGIDPVAESNGIECTNCGECVKACPTKALHYTVGLPGCKSTTPPLRKAAFQLVFLLGISLIIFSVLASSARAHHILGLPHYSYKENYPQAPTLEYPAFTGPYDVLLTSYPGKPVPQEPVSLSIYIKNRNTGDPYAQPISIRVLQTFTFGRSHIVLPPTVCHPFDQPHRLNVTFPEDGEYVVELMMDVEGKPETIPFMVIAGDPSATLSILIIIGAFLFVFVVTVRAIKIKRLRRKRTSLAATVGKA